ncbi:hypothetical protein K501DRAFT_307781, partial [Backusella circina FSU 941]
MISINCLISLITPNHRPFFTRCSTSSHTNAPPQNPYSPSPTISGYSAGPIFSYSSTILITSVIP